MNNQVVFNKFAVKSGDNWVADSDLLKRTAGYKVTAEDWNSIFLILASQADNNASAVKELADSASSQSDTITAHSESISSLNARVQTLETESADSAGFVIDAELSDTSEHAVQNKKVKEAVDDLQAQVTSNLNSIVQHATSFLSKTYPVGSVYMSFVNTDPGTLFGGTWERIQDRSSQAYAVYDSTDQSMTFFRDTPGKYTDGQVSGTKTYYTGFEDITGKTDPSWYNSSSDNQKNTIKTVTFKDKIKPKTCYDWFSGASSLASITGLDKLDTSAVTDMRYMFSGCSSLTNLDVSSFNTAAVTNMSYMFNRCSSLETIYASSLFTTNAVTVGSSSNMFYGCTSLVGGAGTTYDEDYTDKTYARIDGGASNPGYFTAKTVTPSSQAYAVYDSTDQSMTFFRDTPGKYTDGQVSGTKTYYTGFEDITGDTDPSWYASSNQKNTIKTVTFKDKIKPKTCYDWFYGASSLASITGLDKLDTENVTNMGYMFHRCSSLTSLNLSSFNTAKVTNMNWMFKDCSQLKTIYASSLFTTNAVTVGSSYNMFYGCYSLVGGAGTKFDANHTDKTYARIDGRASNPGYFTAKTVTPYLTIYMWKRTA